MKDGHAELGLAFDGDGDRLGVVTKSGRIIYPDRQLMLFAADVLQRNPGAQVIFDVKCTRKLFGWIRAHGGEPVMWKTGHSLIKAKLKETGAPLAGEMSGHIFFKERWYGFDDGLYAGARLLEILSRAPDVSQALEDLPDSISTPELNVALAKEGENHALIARLQKIAPASRAPPRSSPSTACAWSTPTASASCAPPTPRPSSCCASRPTPTRRSPASRPTSAASSPKPCRKPSCRSRTPSSSGPPSPREWPRRHAHSLPFVVRATPCGSRWRVAEKGCRT